MTSLIDVLAETTEIAARPDAALEQGSAADDDELVKIWLHGPLRAYRRAYPPISAVTIALR